MSGKRRKHGDKEYNLHLVSHVHWDREWYLTYQKTRLRLVELLDHILSVIEHDPCFASFMLDSCIILEDYLEIRPENEEKLAKFIRSGRICLVPFYVQSDLFLTSAEAIVRNLMFGHIVSRRFGGSISIGYLPDIPGCPSQLPQILSGFGIEAAVLHRGINGSEVDNKTEFLWRSPDGSKVLVVYMPYGYINASGISGDADTVLKEIESIKEKLAHRCRGSNLLLMRNTLAPLTQLTQLLKSVNSSLQSRGMKLIHSSLEEYISQIRNEEGDLPRTSGELRGIEESDVPHGLLSARIYLKQENEKVQISLEKWAEPFSTFAWTLGEKYPDRFLWQSWKYLLQNHCQDSIGGCSIDDVHRQVQVRFSWALEISEMVADKSLSYICRSIDSSQLADGELLLVVFNPLSWERTDLVIASVDFPISSFVTEFILQDCDGTEVPYQILDHEHTTRAELEPLKRPEYLLVNRWKIAFIAEEVPSLGYRAYKVIPARRQRMQPAMAVAVSMPVIENEYIKVKAKDNGALAITDKQTGHVYDDCNVFQDGGDAGDEYSYSFPLCDNVITGFSRRTAVSLFEAGSVRATLRIEGIMDSPKELLQSRTRRSNDSAATKIISYVSLAARSRRVDITTEIHNKCKDHRLRVLFSSGTSAKYSYAAGHYEVVRRPIKPMQPVDRPDQRGSGQEVDMPTYPKQSFVDVSDGRVGLTIAAIGLPEYEVIDGERQAIALTLLRSVGWLSRNDLLTRGGQAGPVLPAPEAQCIGKHTSRYSLIPHSGTWLQSRSYREAYQHNISMEAIQTGRHNGKLERLFSFLSVEPPELLVSAIMKAVDDDAMILRLYNVSGRDIQGKISVYEPIKSVSLVSLTEEHIRENNNSLSMSGESAFTINVKGAQIVTVKIVS